MAVSNRPGSYLPTPTRASIPALGQMPSSSLASFKNQQLGALTAGTPGLGASNIEAPSPLMGSVAAAKVKTAPVSPVQVQLNTTTQRVKEGNVRLAAIQKAAQPKQQSMAGQYAGGSNFGGRGPSKGQISVKDTVRIGNAYLRKDAGHAFIQMSNAFKQATGRTLGITEGWRSYDEQVRLYQLYKSGRGNLAAKPGTSTHGAGVAVDINGYGDPNGPAFKWLQQNAQKFGYKWTGGTFSQIEPWHWDYVG